MGYSFNVKDQVFFFKPSAADLELEELDLDLEQGRIYFLSNDKWGSDIEKELLSLAHHVDGGSFILFVGEDQEEWGYAFPGNGGVGYLRNIECPLTYYTREPGTNELVPSMQVNRMELVFKPGHELLYIEDLAHQRLIRGENGQWAVPECDNYTSLLLLLHKLARHIESLDVELEYPEATIRLRKVPGDSNIYRQITEGKGNFQ